jgi:hypothetical protein
MRIVALGVCLDEWYYMSLRVKERKCGGNTESVVGSGLDRDLCQFRWRGVLVDVKDGTGFGLLGENLRKALVEPLAQKLPGNFAVPSV